MARPLNLSSLPDEVILCVFECCDVQSLGRLSKTCRKFRDLIKAYDYLWREKSNSVLGSNMVHPEMLSRCNPSSLSEFEKCQLSIRWKHGGGKKRKILRYFPCLPWIYLNASNIYCSKGLNIVEFSRDDLGNAKSRPTHFQPKNVDITKFTVIGDEVVIAFTDGYLGRWTRGKFKEIDCFSAHNDEIFSVDARNDIILSGSRDGTIKIWKMNPDRTEQRKRIPMNVRVLSTAIMPSSRQFIAGMPGTRGVHPLQMFDLSTGDLITTLGENFQYGAGILGIYPEDEHTFLSCGYDTTVQLWDIRCSKQYAARWMDPFDNGVYCVTSDHNITIVSGANRNGVVHVWDKRTSRCAHIFEVEKCNSPIYSIAFDAAHIFSSLNTFVMQHTYF